MNWLMPRKCISIKWVILWSLWAARLVRQPTPEFTIISGLVRGYVSPDGSHVSYLGIPYATVARQHRFKAPGPPPKWDGIFDAINENVKCRQTIDGQTTFGQEDCLVLNVYTPLDVHPDTKIPVMLFIHGGAFFAGSGSKLIYGPNYLVPKGVILVTINYRLNIQGFLCLRTKDAPGNAGMKDQVAALRWVKNNIKSFGGDSDNLTIFGESAGGASVSYHVLSPMSKGLFHKAILQSGSSLAPWALQLSPVHTASLLTKTMGYKTEDPRELYKIFMSKTEVELVLTKVPREDGNTIVSEVLYVPCSEIDIEEEEAFLKETPYKALTKGNYNKVPMIIGSNSEEGYLIVHFKNDTTQTKIKFDKSIPRDLDIPTDNERKQVANTLKSLYMGDEEITKDSIVKLSRLHGEVYFNFPGILETELILNSTDQPVFNYLFNFSSWQSLSKLSLPKQFKEAPGATHADEMFYLFQSFRLSLTLFESEMMDTMTTLWTNFAKHGNPTPPGSQLNLHWFPTDRNNPQALVLDLPPRTQPMWFTSSLLYWKELYQKYRKK